MSVADFMESKLSTVIPNYEARPQQVYLTERMVNPTQPILLANAPTAVGKSLCSYTCAAFRGERTVIATATKKLQHQLAVDDADLARQAFGLDIALVMGRDNYFCTQEARLSLRKQLEMSAELGINFEFDLKDDFIAHHRAVHSLQTIGRAWGLVHSRKRQKNERGCLGLDCSCGYGRALRHSQVADVVICNHALLAIWASCGTWPEIHNSRSIKHVIVDEGDKLVGSLRSFGEWESTLKLTGVAEADKWLDLLNRTISAEKHGRGIRLGERAAMAWDERTVNDFNGISELAAQLRQIFRLKESGGNEFSTAAYYDPELVAAVSPDESLFNERFRSLFTAESWLRAHRDKDLQPFVDGDRVVGVRPISTQWFFDVLVASDIQVTVMSATLAHRMPPRSLSGGLNSQAHRAMSTSACRMFDGQDREDVEYVLVTSPFSSDQMTFEIEPIWDGRPPRAFPVDWSGNNKDQKYRVWREYVRTLARETGTSAIAAEGYTLLLVGSRVCMQNVVAELREHAPTFRVYSQDDPGALDGFVAQPQGAILVGLSTGAWGTGLSLPGMIRELLLEKLQYPTPNDVDKAGECRAWGLSSSTHHFRFGVYDAVRQARQNLGRAIRTSRCKAHLRLLDGSANALLVRKSFTVRDLGVIV